MSVNGGKAVHLFSEYQIINNFTSILQISPCIREKANSLRVSSLHPASMLFLVNMHILGQPDKCSTGRIRYEDVQC